MIKSEKASRESLGSEAVPDHLYSTHEALGSVLSSANKLVLLDK